MRKFTGNVVEFASIFAVGFSPLWILAAASDVMGGSKAYLRTLVTELQRPDNCPRSRTSPRMKTCCTAWKRAPACWRIRSTVPR